MGKELHIHWGGPAHSPYTGPDFGRRLFASIFSKSRLSWLRTVSGYPMKRRRTRSGNSGSKCFAMISAN